MTTTDQKRQGQRSKQKEKKSKNTDGKQAIKLKHGELRSVVLRSIFISAYVGASVANPLFPIGLGILLKTIQGIKDFKIPQKKVERVLKNLEKKKIISLERSGGEVQVHVKNQYHHSIVKYSIQSLLDFRRKHKKWRGKWILVIFDVPEKERNKRDYLRRFLVDLGFYSYQKSVYIFPYECEHEITLIKKIVEAGKYIKYIIATHIEGESAARRYFNI